MKHMGKYLKNHTALFFGVLLLGALLRFYHLGETSFVADEFLDINASYGYFKTGEWQAWDFNFGRPDMESANADRDERAFAYKAQVAALFHVLPPTEGVARSVSAAWGLVSLALVFWMTASLTKRKEMGLLAAFLYAISVSALLIDRRLRMYAMFVPVFMAFSWTVFLFLEREYRGKLSLFRWAWRRFGFNLSYFAPALALGILGLHLHLLTVMIAATVLAYAAVRSVQVRGLRNKYGLILSVFCVGTAGLRLAAPGAFDLLSSSFSFPDNHYGYLGIVLKDYSHALLALIFFVLGVRRLVGPEGRPKEGWWLALSFLVPLFMAVFMWDRNVGDQYISFAQPFKMAVVAAGVFAFVEFCGRHLSASFGRRAVIAPLALSLLVLPNYAYFASEDNTYRQTSRSGNPPYRKIFAYVMKNRTPEDIVITRDLRGYYLGGADMHVENIGGEITRDKLTGERLQDILSKYPSGWVVLSDNDDSLVSHDAMAYIEKNMERISNPQVRSTASVYRWK
jgi:hypothetical protein